MGTETEPRFHDSVEGELVPVAPKVLVHRGFFGYGAFSSSSTGSIAYRASAGETQLVWLDRDGPSRRHRGTGRRQPDDLYQLSRDGRAVAVTRTVDGNTNVWLLDIERGSAPPADVRRERQRRAILSPDGSRVVHQANGNRVTGPSSMNGVRTVPDGDDPAARRIRSTNGITRRTGLPTDATSCIAVRRRRASICGLCHSFGERTPFDVARTSFAESNGRFSPDGRWVAYQSTETGRSRDLRSAVPGPGTEGRRFPSVEARSRAGGATEASCSTSRLTGA